jgi:hypothetical protein
MTTPKLWCIWCFGQRHRDEEWLGLLSGGLGEGEGWGQRPQRSGAARRMQQRARSGYCSDYALGPTRQRPVRETRTQRDWQVVPTGPRQCLRARNLAHHGKAHMAAALGEFRARVCGWLVGPDGNANNWVGCRACGRMGEFWAGLPD